MESIVGLSLPIVLFLCVVMSSLYVLGIYLSKGSTANRDRPDVIRKRAVGVLCACLINVVILSFSYQRETIETDSAPDLSALMGFRVAGIAAALVLPLILTMILFLGPMATAYVYGLDESVLFNQGFWHFLIRDWISIRNLIIAPLSEELCFRACMLPLLVPALGVTKAIFVCPLFFGFAHFHHLYEKVHVHGLSWKSALQSTLFQFTYTTLFGMYSAFVFLRTGHLASAVLAHAFCNHMGFPDFYPLIHARGNQRVMLVSAFVGGLVLWIMLLFPLTTPAWYSNSVYKF